MPKWVVCCCLLISAIVPFEAHAAAAGEATASAAPVTYAIPPGQEALLQAALNPPGGLAPGWSYFSAQIKASRVDVYFAPKAKGGQKAHLVLVHPSIAPAGSLVTKKFGIVVPDGAPADWAPLAQALKNSLAAKEGPWQWLALTDSTGDGTGDGEKQAAAKANDKSGDKSGDKQGDKSGDKTGDKQGDKAGDKTGDKTGDKVGDKSGDKKGDKAGDKQGDPTGDRTGDPTGDDHSDSTGTGGSDPRGDPTGDASGDATGDASGDNGGAKKNDPVSVHARVLDLLRRAQHAIDAGTPDIARDYVAKTLAEGDKLEKHRRAVWLDIEVGFLLRDAGDPDGAKTHFEQALADANARIATEQNEPARVLEDTSLKLRALLGLKRDSEALQEIETLKKGATSPEEVCKLAALGRTLGHSDRLDDGVNLLQWVLDKNEKCARGYIYIAEICRDAKQFDRAGPMLEKGAKVLPDDSGVVTQLANYYKFKDRRPEAIRLLEDLAKAGHAEPGLLGELLGLYTRAGIPQESIDLFRSRADADQNDLVSAFFAGVLMHYKIKGNKEKRALGTPKDAYDVSNAYLLRAEKAFAQEPRLYIYLAMNQYHVGNIPEAAKLIEKAVNLGQADPDVYYCRAMIGMDTDPRKSLKDFDRYLSLTKNAFDKFAHKEQFVRGLVKDLRECVDAKVPSECIEHQGGARRAGVAAYGIVAIVAVIGLAIFLRLRRKMPPVAMILFALLGGSAATAHATEKPSAQALLREADGSEFVPGEGWTLTEKGPFPDRIVMLFVHEKGERLEVDLVPRGQVPKPLLRTKSFDVGYSGRIAGKQNSDTREWRLLRRVFAAIDRNDPGGVELAETTIQGIGPNVPYALAAQVSWMSDLDLAQCAVALFLLVLALFFCPPRTAARSVRCVA